ncbi:MAG: E3 ubiquitin--protein ligase [Legionella sp.]|uniref:U-box domain-containing protein n=1 Tax=Legionella sp. TaxID=459 RepID=UPI002843EEF6|nr:E3 ubiquitin--protein ligase [Legionella sp.]
MSFEPKSNNQMSHKAKYLGEAVQEAKTTHPEESPSMLLCPISGDFMKKPVITPEGKVYDEEFILTHLATKKDDPQTRKGLKAKELKDFSELLGPIKEFTQRKEEYVKKKEAFIQQVRQIVHQEGVLPEKPALFLCPISHNLIKNPVITSKGKVYDRDSLTIQGKDETGLALSSNDVVPFKEFKEQLNVFHFYLTKQQYQKEKEHKLSSSPLSFFSGIITSLFGSDDHSEDNTHDDRSNLKK